MKKISILLFLVTFGLSLNLMCQSVAKQYFERHTFCQIVSEKFDIELSVDPRIEFLQTLMLLAGNPHTNNENAAYKMAILDEYGHFKSHPAMVTFRDLVRKKFNSMDAPIFFFVRLNQGFELRNDVDNTAYKNDTDIDLLLESVRSLAAEMDYIAFFNKQLPLYTATLSTFEYNLLDFDEKTRMLRYYKQDNASDYKFKIVLNLLGKGNFGPGLQVGPVKELYAIISPGTSAGNLSVFDLNEVHYLVWHEFSHSFVNPLVDLHYDEFQKSEHLFHTIAQSMQAQAYQDWRVTLKEHLVRAVTCRLAEIKYGEEYADLNYTSTEIGKKYIYLPLVIEELVKYEKKEEQSFGETVLNIAKRLQKWEALTTDEVLAQVERIRRPDVDDLPVIGEVNKNVLIIVPAEILAQAKPGMTWPGQAMKKWKDDWYYMHLGSLLKTHLIFNDQSGIQTGDLLDISGTQFYDGEKNSWIDPPADLNYEDLATIEGVLVFFKMPKTWQHPPFVYAWQDTVVSPFNDFIKRYLSYFQGGQLVSDQQALTMDVNDHDLIIFGNFQNNAFLKKNYSEIPVKFTKNGMIADKHYEADDLVLITAWLHPTDKERKSELYISNKMENLVNMDWVERGGTHYHITRGVISIKAGNYARRMKIWRF